MLVPAHLIDGCSFRAGIEFASIKVFIRQSQPPGRAEALSSLLPEHSPSKKRRTEASSCIVGVWINEAEKVVASTCCRMRCTTVCSSIGAGSRQPERSFWPLGDDPPAQDDCKAHGPWPGRKHRH